MDGLLLIDKPSGITSFEVLRELKKRYQESKMGHLGTLDPLATGLLPVFMGKATKLITHFSEADKRYWVQFELGKFSDTYDVTGEVQQGGELPSQEAIQTQLKKMLGSQWQIQPSFSAIKVQGKRSYTLAREGKPVDLGKRQVVLDSIEQINIKLPVVELVLSCSSGTYVRSFVHELGEHLECGAVMTALRRQAVGPFEIESAKSLNNTSDKDVISLTNIVENYLPKDRFSMQEKAYLLRKLSDV